MDFLGLRKMRDDIEALFSRYNTIQTAFNGELKYARDKRHEAFTKIDNAKAMIENVQRQVNGRITKVYKDQLKLKYDLETEDGLLRNKSDYTNEDIWKLQDEIKALKKRIKKLEKRA